MSTDEAATAWSVLLIGRQSVQQVDGGSQEFNDGEILIRSTQAKQLRITL